MKVNLLNNIISSTATFQNRVNITGTRFFMLLKNDLFSRTINFSSDIQILLHPTLRSNLKCIKCTA